MEWRDELTHKAQGIFSIFQTDPPSPKTALLIPKKEPVTFIQFIKKMFSVPEPGSKVRPQ